MAYGDYDGPNKPDKGKENGSCNRTRCQCSPAIYYNHGSYAWYCQDCARDIWDANKRTFHIDMPNIKHPMFETRGMMDDRLNQSPPPLDRKAAKDMTADEREAELARVEARIANGFGERGGSPGEWWHERADELRYWMEKDQTPPTQEYVK